MVPNSKITPTEIISAFHALSDPLRLQVLELLARQELCVCDLCDRLGVAQSKLSFHLKALRSAGLVHARQQGRWVYYRPNLHSLALLEQYLASYHRNGMQVQKARPCDP